MGQVGGLIQSIVGQQDPLTTGWLLSLLPSDLEEEVQALILADAQHRFS